MEKYFFAGFGLTVRRPFADGFSNGVCKREAHAVMSATAVFALAAAAAGAVLALIKKRSA